MKAPEIKNVNLQNVCLLCMYAGDETTGPISTKFTKTYIINLASMDKRERDLTVLDNQSPFWPKTS